MIKKGDKYLCKTSYFNNFIETNIYEVKDVKGNAIAFIDAFNNLHYVDLEDLQTDFTDLNLHKIEVKEAEIVIPKNDPIVSSVMFQLAQRSILGQQKYGTTLEDNNTDDFLEHLKQELMDAILYIEKLQSKK